MKSTMSWLNLVIFKFSILFLVMFQFQMGVSGLIFFLIKKILFNFSTSLKLKYIWDSGIPDSGTDKLNESTRHFKITALNGLPCSWSNKYMFKDSPI